MFRLEIRAGKRDEMPTFPDRLTENPPRQGFFEHDEYLRVRGYLPAPYQDVLDFAYYSGWLRPTELRTHGHLTRRWVCPIASE